MLLSIIIVSWNVSHLLEKCLESVFKHAKDLDFEIFVVDNHSKDDSAVMVATKFPQVSLMINSINRGFSQANNQAIKQAQGKYILLLNPDTEISENSIKNLINFADSNQNIGIVGPKILNPDLSLQRSCRRFPGFWDQFFIQLKFYNLFPRKIPTIKKYFMFDFDHQHTMQVDQIMGAAMLIKKSVFEKIGLLDEKFWAVFEEVDFCFRAYKAGFKIYFFPQAKIIHHKGQSFNQVASLRRQINFNHSLYHYFHQHKPFYQFFILWCLQPLNLLLTLIDIKLSLRKSIGKNKDL